MVQYDAKVIQQFAERLYTQARRIALTSTIYFAILGFILGAVLASVIVGRAETLRLSSTAPMGVIIGATVLCGLLGFVHGTQRSFMLRLQAQTALCQLQIEANTRSEKPR